MQHCILVLICSLLIDAIIGDPKWLWKRISHPIVGFGKLISIAEKIANNPNLSNDMRRFNGYTTIFIVCLIAILFGTCLNYFSAAIGVWGIVLDILILWCFLAQKSLYDHVYDVYYQFTVNSIDEARRSVSMIVGRNTQDFDESAISRAAIESLAENSSDGVIAPILFYLFFGLPGLLFYKMVNTADSMIAHKNERYLYFGYAAAKLDDIANYIPSRVTAFIALITVFIKKGHSVFRRCFSVMIHDAPKHRSPNGGWPETVYAAFLNIQLSGPRIYDNVQFNEPVQNINGRSANINDVKLALSFFKMNMLLILFIFIFIFCFLTFLHRFN